MDQEAFFGKGSRRWGHGGNSGCRFFQSSDAPTGSISFMFLLPAEEAQHAFQRRCRAAEWNVRFAKTRGDSSGGQRLSERVRVARELHFLPPDHASWNISWARKLNGRPYVEVLSELTNR